MSYTTRDVARLLGLSEPQVRSQARAGFLVPDRGPRNTYRFSFQDLVVLRTARELARAKIPPRRILTALRSVVRQLPTGRSLTEITMVADGDHVAVRDGGETWNPESGQLVLDFQVNELAPRPTPIAGRPERSPVRADEQLDTDQWFEFGVDSEATSPGEACGAYRRVLSLEPGHTDANVNLGRLLQLAGRTRDAVEHYRAALASGPSHSTAAFNLGTALEELGQSAEAMAAYRRALLFDRRCADAHFNLALLYERDGRRAEAIEHLKAYEEFSY